MKKIFLVLISCLTLGVQAQEEKFVYCVYNSFPTSYDSVTVEKINEQHIGDTIIKTFEQIDNGKQFNYYIFNDSIFSKYENQYYLIGSNHAQIGDVWQPLWYELYQYDKNTNSFGDTCAFQRKLKVIGIEQITVGSEYRLKYKLKILDSLAYSNTSFYFYFIEGIGVTTGGLYYNLDWQADCDSPTDVPDVIFKYYEIDGYQYIENNCKTTTVNNTNELANVNFKAENNYLHIQGIENENFNISIIDLTGKFVLQAKNQKEIGISSLKGLFIIQLTSEKGSKVVKFNFM